MIKATLGFIFNKDLTEVLLITKNRPEWQKGAINGLGGKCEKGESMLDCVAREVWEESGLKIVTEDYKYVGELHWTEWEVAVFAAMYSGNKNDAKTLTDEPVVWYRVDNLPKKCKTNLTWLIPLSIEVLTSSTPPKVNTVY